MTSPLCSAREALENVRGHLVDMERAALIGRTHDVWERAHRSGLRTARKVVDEALSALASSPPTHQDEPDPAALPRCDKLDGSTLRIVPSYTEAGRFCGANCLTITDGERAAIYVPYRVVAIASSPPAETEEGNSSVGIKPSPTDGTGGGADDGVPKLYYDPTLRGWVVLFSEPVPIGQPITLPMHAVAAGNNPYYTPTIMAAFRAYKEGEYGGKLPDELFRLGNGSFADEPYYTKQALEFRIFKAGAEWIEEFRRADAGFAPEARATADSSLSAEGCSEVAEGETSQPTEPNLVRPEAGAPSRAEVALAQFWRRLTVHFWSDEATDMDGADFQDWAVDCGLVVETKYDPEIHGATSICEPGDAWYEPTPHLAAYLRRVLASEDKVPQSLKASEREGGDPLPDRISWKWYASTDVETYTVGPCDTREQAIEEGRRYFDGERFHIVEARKGTFKKWLPSADRILELMTESADEDECCGEEYAELSGNVKAAEDDLTAQLSAWYDRHAAIFPKPWVFGETRNEEWIARDPTEVPARDLTDEELIAEQARVEKLWEEMHSALEEDGGRGGSPGEWMVERMDEIATEQQRRAAKSAPPALSEGDKA